MTLASAEEALASGNAQVILATVVLALVAGMVWLVRLHLVERAEAQKRETALYEQIQALQEKRLGLAERVFRAVEAIGDDSREERQP